MNNKNLSSWFSTVSIILILFGVLYCFAGLKIFVTTGILPVDKDVLIDWESALYGAIMIGWGTTPAPARFYRVGNCLNQDGSD